MTLPAGTTCETKIEDRLRLMIAACATYDDFVGRAGASESALLGSIHIDEFTNPADYEAYTDTEFAAIFNGCLVYLGDEAGVQWSRESESQFVPSGVAHVRLRRLIPAADRDDGEKAFRDFKNLAGEIMAELRAQVGQDDTTTLRILDMVRMGPWKSDDDEEPSKPYIEVEYQFEFS
jgi:hypothetical protein